MPVPAVEGVALAGGGNRLAHEALGVGDALLEGLAREEFATIGDVHHVEQVLLLGVLGPLGEHGHVVLAGHGLLEVDLVEVLLLVGQAVEAGYPVPACEGVALAGGGCGLAHEALGVGHALLEGLTGGELAAIGHIENVDLVLLGVLGPLGVHSGMIHTSDRLSKVNLVGFLLLVSVLREILMPVPTGEGVALAGGGGGLAHEALGVGQTLLNLLAVSELTAVGDVRDVDLVLLLVLDPLSIDGSALLNGLGEIDLVGFLLLVGVVRVVCMPVPAGEGVALAGGRRRLTEHSVGIGNTLHGLVTVKELTAVGNVQDVDLVLFFGLVGLVVNVKRGDALEGGGHIYFDCAGCDARDDLMSGITLELALDAIRNIAACGNLDNGGLAGAIAVAANKVAHNLDALGCVLLPCGKPVASLGSSRLELQVH